MNIFSLLSYCIESDIKISEDFTRDIYRKFKDIDVDDRDRMYAFNFLEDVFDKYPENFTDPQKKEFEELRLKREFNLSAFLTGCIK